MVELLLFLIWLALFGIMIVNAIIGIAILEVVKERNNDLEQR